MQAGSFTRRGFLWTTAAGSAVANTVRSQPSSGPPNIVLIVCDDLGYGDLGCYGSKIPTPNIDSLATQGVQFTQAYSGAAVCSPSRAALLTGRYASRTGVSYVLQPTDTTGLGDSEVTMGHMLHKAGYRNMCAGKWHVGSKPQFMPNNRGFDEFYGLPYSIDMDPLPLMHNSTVVEQPANLNTLTSRYTAQAANFISSAQKNPFFLYFAHSFPHIPSATSTAFQGVTGLGKYADTIAEIDWSVGQILQTLDNNNLTNNTLVLFTSDHGPWYQGSTGNLRGRKGETFEGGMRVPFLARMPGTIPAGLVNSTGFVSAIDLFPTIGTLSGASPCPNLLDGIDVWSMMTGERDTIARDALLFIDNDNIQAARLGPWKLHVARYNTPPWVPVPADGRVNLTLTNPELYNLAFDPGETSNVAADYPQVVADIQKRIANLLPNMPANVQTAWSCTMNTPVAWSPDGACPIPKN